MKFDTMKMVIKIIAFGTYKSPLNKVFNFAAFYFDIPIFSEIHITGAMIMRSKLRGV